MSSAWTITSHSPGLKSVLAFQDASVSYKNKVNITDIKENKVHSKECLSITHQQYKMMS